MDSFYIILGPNANHPSVEAWSAERLPFEPKGWKLQFRDDLREELRRLSFVPDSDLSALYVSPVKEYCDVENIVFYNIGAAPFEHLQCKCIRFERVFSQPPTPPKSGANGWKHYLSYTLITGGRGFAYWEPVRLLARWEHLPCGKITGTSKAESVWYWFKLGIGAGRVQQLVTSEVLTANLGLKVTIHIPKSTSLNLTSVIKPVFDGIVAAFNRHDGSWVNLIAERLATTLSVDQKDLAYFLEDGAMAILGARRLVWPRASGVQWNPSDDLLVAGELSLVGCGSDREWGLSGELFEGRQTKSRNDLL